MHSCQICNSKKIHILKDFKRQNLCNRYLKKTNYREFKYPLILSQCNQCGLIQLKKAVPSKQIAQKFNWLKYYEPEDHLNKLANIVKKLPLPKHPTSCGITYKDDSLLKRLKLSKFKSAWRIKPKEDLGITIPTAAGETIIPKLTDKNLKKLIKKYKKVDFLVARHVLEHAPNTEKFMNSMKKLLNPNGYLLFEVPDCSTQLEYFDYTMLWEEHTLYFTSDIFKNYFKYYYTKLKFFKFIKYKYPIENALVVILKNSKNDLQSKRKNILNAGNLNIGKRYGKNFDTKKNMINKKLAYFKKKYGKIAIYGAGHISTMFINLMGIKKYISAIIDDNKEKQKFLMPGSKLPIKSKKFLLNNKIKVCLLSLNPESERKVIKKNIKFLKSGGLFFSLFPYYKNSIFK